MSLQPAVVRGRIAVALIGFWAVLAGAFLGLATVKYFFPVADDGMMRTFLGVGFSLLGLACSSYVWRTARPTALALASLGVAGYGFFPCVVVLLIRIVSKANLGKGMLAVAMVGMLLAITGVVGASLFWTRATPSTP